MFEFAVIAPIITIVIVILIGILTTPKRDPKQEILT